MLKRNIGFNRQTGEANYGSQYIFVNSQYATTRPLIDNSADDVGIAGASDETDRAFHSAISRA